MIQLPPMPTSSLVFAFGNTNRCPIFKDCVSFIDNLLNNPYIGSNLTYEYNERKKVVDFLYTMGNSVCESGIGGLEFFDKARIIWRMNAVYTLI